MWWILQNTRLLSEKAMLQDLEGRCDWLHVKKWHALNIQSMCVEFDVTVSEEVFSFQMRYPSVFPDAPPMIYPENKERISSHQYSNIGELCLEYRPDNWRPELTGADMVISCHKLLQEENTGSNQTEIAHSAHAPSLGRDLRTKSCRFLITNADIAFVNKLKSHIPETIYLRERSSDCGNGPSYISSISHIGEKGSVIWTSNLTTPSGDLEYSGVVIRFPNERDIEFIDLDTLKDLLKRNDLDYLIKSLLDVSKTTKLLIGDGNSWFLLWIFTVKNERKVLPYKTVLVPSAQKRLVDELSVLSEKRVGIVGCGSVGSKIAASLCRSGVGKFILIDEDIFFPANVVRNELTLKDIGCHKSYALKSHLQEINPSCDVVALRLALGGQESSESMTGTLEALGLCDLLIDATADAKAFNLTSSVSRRQKIPMIWAEVFSGGIGGLVARARPDIDPLPIYAKQQIESWCENQGVDWNRENSSDNYEGTNSEGIPMIADDAEVSVIAMHAVRFAIDTLARSQDSIFPESAYLIGLSSDWLFSQPFDTWPIQLSAQGDWGENVDQLCEGDLKRLINEYLPTAKEKH